MSRICGLISPGDAARRHDLLRMMLERVGAPPHRRERVLHGGSAALGWSGVDAPPCAQKAGVLVVMDGVVLNRDAFEPQKSDADLLLDLYLRYGLTDALSRLWGDFAVAVHDVPRGTLWLGRDRLGVRPLYWTRQGPLVAFASRPAALFGLPGVSRRLRGHRVARLAAAHYRLFDDAPEESPYADIAQLPAATALKVTEAGERATRWWSVEDAPELAGTQDELAGRYRDLIFDAVDRRMAVMPAVGFTLSGGMDSSTVLASAARGVRAKQVAFSTVYADRTFDESEDIQPMLDHAVSRWERVPVDAPDVMALVRDMVRLHDEPVATATWLSHWLLARHAAAQGVRTLFGGLGGDELNAGEYEYFPYYFAELRRAGRHADLAREIAGWVEHHNHPIYTKSTAVAMALMDRLTDAQRPGICLPDTDRMTRYAAALSPDMRRMLERPAPQPEHPFPSCLKNRTWQDLTRETMPCCLRAEDRHCAALGMQAAHPFLDHRLVEFMYRVPDGMKIENGVTKVLLRRAMHGTLPEATRTRVTKTGWNAPAHVWFAGEGGDELMDMVRGRAFRERGIYDPAEVERLVMEHRTIVAEGAPRENHMMFLWQVVNMEIWLDGLDSRRAGADMAQAAPASE